MMKKRITAMILSIGLTLTGCGTPQTQDTDANAKIVKVDLMSNVKANAVSTDADITGKESAAVTDFGVRLFQQSVNAGEGNNTLISPLSVLYALAMTANGADGETLAQMEEVFGLPVKDLNVYLHAYMESLPAEEQYKLYAANSIWFKDSGELEINQDFLQTNADYYGAGIYQAPFDNSTLQEINYWVDENTDGMIDSILDKISADEVMYLINALAFDAEWQKIYDENDVRDGTFTKEDGTEQDIELMYSEEDQYLEDENAQGFIKYYADQKYAFAALLPNEGISVTDYAASLNGEKLSAVLNGAQNIPVNAAIPKFENDYSVDMRDVLTDMGITDAFDDSLSDFSRMGNFSKGDLSVSRVLHKTFITVDERGTKAGAATSAAMEMKAGMPVEEMKTVYLDRPFVYMLIDCEANIPIFIGQVVDIEE